MLSLLLFVLALSPMCRVCADSSSSLAELNELKEMGLLTDDVAVARPHHGCGMGVACVRHAAWVWHGCGMRAA
eukprot:SAG11_NODE_6_length_32111_cov_33.703174_13_plen_73_part_00